MHINEISVLSLRPDGVKVMFTSSQFLRDKIGNFFRGFYDSNAQTSSV